MAGPDGCGVGLGDPGARVMEAPGVGELEPAGPSGVAVGVNPEGEVVSVAVVPGTAGVWVGIGVEAVHGTPTARRASPMNWGESGVLVRSMCAAEERLRV
jgi:hypothetical protein